MPRAQNTDKNGQAWSDSDKLRVWKKGSMITNFSPDIWRRDRYGYVMKYSDHGDRKSKYGWEIDHINPVSNQGQDDLDNLQPLYWENNNEKSDTINWKGPNRNK